MIYFLTTVLFLLGVGFQISQTMEKLKGKYPEFRLRQVLDTYFKEEWNVLIRSGLVLCTYELALFILEKAEVKLPEWWDKYMIPYGLALVMGYAGHRIIYKYLGTTEQALSDKADKLKDV